MLSELKKKSDNENVYLKLIQWFVKGLLISITFIAVITIGSYFWSPPDYSEYNSESKNLNIGDEKNDS